MRSKLRRCDGEVRWLLVVLSVLLLMPGAATAQPPSNEPTSDRANEADTFQPILQLLDADRRERREILDQLRQAEPNLTSPLVDALFFLPRAERGPVFDLLEAWTDEEPGDRYLDWVEVVGRRTDLPPPAGYAAFKLELLSRIDPDYRKIFYPGAPTRIRLEEVVWGGVPLDGIPVLERPMHVDAAEAGHMRGGEVVFGAVVAGQARAYPLRMLAWHEMLNDVLGGEPVTLSYCTLCGSAILYSTSTRGEPYSFGTSGLLYRSNKLMFDRQTYSLWSNLTGEPVVGRRARGDVRLPQLPLTRTTWRDWSRRYPHTTVLTLDRDTERRTGFRYRTGAAQAARRGVSFPVWQRDTRLERGDEVYALRFADAPPERRAEQEPSLESQAAGSPVKAYALEPLLELGVLHDELAGRPLVLLADEDSGAVRVYERATSSQRFTRSSLGLWRDDTGALWRVDEDAMRCVVEGALRGVEGGCAEEGAQLARWPGHVAFWFGWYGFYPDTQLWLGGQGMGSE